MATTVKVITSAKAYHELIQAVGITAWAINPPTIEATPTQLAMFAIQATLILGPSDATMLALIIQNPTPDWYSFPGWELY